MERTHGTVSGWMHRNLLGLLLASYAAASLVPTLGLWLRGVKFGHGGAAASLPLVLLGFLLFNAGLGARPEQLRAMLRSPRLLLLGLAANLAVPVAFLAGAAPALGLWPDPVEARAILLGLALVAAMPIAGSSASWSQHGGGDLALSLGLVLGSTLLSPWTTPLVLGALAPLLGPEYAAPLQSIAHGGTGALLGLFVMLPAVAGVAVGTALGSDRAARLRGGLKTANLAVLLLLVYANAATSLPETTRNPDFDFLALAILASGALCASAFAAGWAIGRLADADAGRRTALMFGLGMNNNGTGMVVASMLLADVPLVLVPILIYNLVQHLAAGFVHRMQRPCAAMV
jgi:BASS family bile acid:Na+ symporter